MSEAARQSTVAGFSRISLQDLVLLTPAGQDTLGIPRLPEDRRVCEETNCDLDHKVGTGIVYASYYMVLVAAAVVVVTVMVIMVVLVVIVVMVVVVAVVVA